MILTARGAGELYIYFAVMDMICSEKDYWVRFLRIFPMVEVLIRLPSFFNDSASLPSSEGA